MLGTILLVLLCLYFGVHILVLLGEALAWVVSSVLSAYFWLGQTLLRNPQKPFQTRWRLHS